MNERERAVADKLIDYFVENLRVPREAIDYDTPLFGEGLGLDSVDSLEIIAGIDLLFNVSVVGLDYNTLGTIETLSRYIAAATADNK